MSFIDGIKMSPATIEWNDSAYVNPAIELEDKPQAPVSVVITPKLDRSAGWPTEIIRRLILMR